MINQIPCFGAKFGLGCHSDQQQVNSANVINMTFLADHQVTINHLEISPEGVSDVIL